ncbi:MAG: hypothetical protein DWQ34_03060 [Planctomycetota bacterium]|nr:MAG: hypothetical protein DWQ34_03060 [Planctomycetota bacterium]REK21495.1 MAG: hypothetical protein DWQ41_21290 [Planctomycetota bacterium]REK34332.1 MAG: hypothetical protein DWQ45_13730 [Planctomycetota bacterium]
MGRNDSEREPEWMIVVGGLVPVLCGGFLNLIIVYAHYSDLGSPAFWRRLSSEAIFFLILANALLIWGVAVIIIGLLAKWRRNA